MPTFSQVAKGTRARKAIPLPLQNTRCDLLPDLPELAAQRTRDRESWDNAARAGTAPPVAPDDPHTVDLRVLTGAEESLVLQKAREHAVTGGVPHELAKSGDALFEVGRMVWTLALGVLDHDSTAEDPKPYFDGGAKQILDEVDGDLIAFLFARWEQWQGECSLRLGTLSGPQFWEQMVKVTVTDDDLPFSQMRPVMQWILCRSMGGLLLSSPEAKSQFMSVFGESPTPKTTPPTSAPAPKSKSGSRRSAK